MRRLYELYIRFIEWLGADSSSDNILAPPPVIPPSTDKSKVKPEEKPENLKITTSNNSFLDELIEKIREPVLTIVATFIIFLVFLITEQILFWIFNWQTQDLQLRNSFFKWLFDGIEFLTAISIAIYSFVQGVLGLIDQWKIANTVKGSK